MNNLTNFTITKRTQTSLSRLGFLWINISTLSVDVTTGWPFSYRRLLDFTGYDTMALFKAIS